MTMTQPSAADVVIVGAGVAGLTAACYLARAGVDVILLEKSSRLGGRAATTDNDGYRFNVGIHALYTGGAASRVFDDLGISYTYGVPKDTFVLRDGRISPFPTDPMGLLRTDALDFRAKLALVRFVTTIKRTQPSAVRRRSVQAWLDDSVSNAQLRTLLRAFARTLVYSTALDLVSAEVFVDKFKRSLSHPVHYIDGGWQTLVDGLHDTATRDGARVVSGTGVEAVICDGDRVTGVRSREGVTVAAGGVLLATAATDAARLVDAGGSTALRRLVDGLVPAPLACLDVALDRLPVPTHPIVQDLDEPRFMSAQSVYSRIAPDGAALIASFKQRDPRITSSAEKDEADLEQLLDTAQPGWRDHVVRRRFLPAIEAVGALPTASGGGFEGRPSVDVPGLASLCVAGDWVGREGFLVDASAASAAAAAASMIDAPRARVTPTSPTVA
jgi:phytoene dehydrogenase-like protein